MILLILVGLVVICILWLVLIYNGLVTLNNRTEEAWSDIEVQLKRRYDLIPNLISTVKGYAKHEKTVFEETTRARTAALNASGVAERQKAENMLTQALKSVFAVAENYPDLKASANFVKLQDELTDTENKIEAARRFYNANVRDLNIKMEVFPNNLFAKKLGFQKRELFDIEESQIEKVIEPPKVEF